MKSSGTPAGTRGQNPKPSIPQSGDTAGVPELVLPAPAKDFTAYGLRKGPGGYTLCRVEVMGPLAKVTEVRQAEPQRAIAFAYLEQAVEEAYIAERG